MRRYETSLIFERPGAGWFKPTPTSPRVPLLPWSERPNTRRPWGPQQTTAFLEVIKRLTTHPVLVLPNWNQPFTLHTDASTLATGAVLTQEVDGGSRHGPVGYHSKRLSRAQQDASANDREVLGVMNAVEHFEIYLQHRQFTLILSLIHI